MLNVLYSFSGLIYISCIIGLLSAYLCYRSLMTIHIIINSLIVLLLCIVAIVTVSSVMIIQALNTCVKISEL
jgi:hypothetical protein